MSNSMFLNSMRTAPSPSGRGAVCRPCHSFAGPRAARGFTLVELMVVLVIIGILASVVMFAMFNAQETAREAKTKNMISKLNALVMPRYESYMNRRVPLPPATAPNNVKANEWLAFRRLQALRELMRMELPDHWMDVFDRTNPPSANESPVTGVPVPNVTRTYRRIVQSRLPTEQLRTDDNFQGAECLYLIVAYGLEEPDALTHFSQSDIGDADNDGLPEFLDGWGQPISFIRWPAGFDSPRQAPRDEWKAFDQFNVRKVTPDIQGSRTVGLPQRFALYPLIFSGGPDKGFDLRVDRTLKYSVPAPNINSRPYLDPYIDLGGGMQIGAPFDADSNGLEHADNIHNHDLVIR